MTTAGGHRAGRLLELDDQECWDLIRSVQIGRLIWQGQDGLTAVPVNFVAGDGEVRLLTAAYSALARECDESPVAFQVDSFDETSRSGWSVLIRGTARIDYDRPSGGTPDPEPWPGGARPLAVVVPAISVTGRRLLA